MFRSKSTNKSVESRESGSAEISKRYVSGDANDKTFKQFPPVHENNNVLCLNSAKRGQCLSGGTDSVLTLTDLNSRSVVDRWSGHEKDITKVLYGPNVDLYFSSSRDKTVKIWRRNQQTPVQQCIGHDLVVSAITVNADNTVLCSGSRDNSIRLWDVSSGRCLKTNSLSQNLITHVCWANQLNVIAQSGEDKELRLWDARNLNVVSAFPRKQYIQTYCDVSEDNNYCLTTSNGFGGNGCEATLWDLRTNRLVHEFKGHFETAVCCRFIPSSLSRGRKVVVTSSNDCSIRLWDQETRECLQTETISGSGPLTSIAIFEDGNLCVSSFNAGIQLLCLCASPNGRLSLKRTAAF